MADRRAGWRKLDRRALLRLGLSAGAAGGIGLGIGFFGGTRFERRQMRVPPRSQPFSPSVFLAIDDAGVTTVWVTRSEMGQGVSTALPMIVAEELDADWSSVRIELAPASRTYGYQGTMASASVISMFDELREAGAIARSMLVRAAAEVWQVDLGACSTRPGFVVHTPSGRSLGYGALSSRAGALEVPATADLKDQASYRRVGTPTRRLDARDKAEGRAVYGIDVRPADLLFASIERGRGVGGRVGAVDEAAARGVAGVQDVVRLDSGDVAVLADHTFAAFAGRRALNATHRPGANAALTTGAILERLREASRSSGAEVYSLGEVEAGLRRASRTIEALIEVPYLAHQCMEPINATARVLPDRCEVWAPTQDPQRVQALAAELTGLSLGDCYVHVTLLGGGFGRRTIPTEIQQVIELARRAAPRPVQLVWTREDTLRHDYFRPAAVHRFAVGLDAQGSIAAWRHHIATPSPSGEEASGGDVDRIAVDGAAEIPYRVGAAEVRWSDVASAIPTGIWRSVGHSYNAFAVEVMIDEVARAAERDPIELRLELLADHARQRAVLERVREMSGWGGPNAEGRARGVAVHGCFGSVCAQVAEVSLEGGRPRVHRVWAAVECGLVVNPLGVEAQIMGGIVFGLAAALYGRVTVEGGAVAQSNFHDAPIVRMPECPEIEVRIVARDASPGGIGEVGVPPIAPAVANAVAVLRGAPVRRLPLG